MKRLSAAQQYESLTQIAERDWHRLDTAERVDRSHGYLRFREYVEPGAPLVAGVLDGTGLGGVLHGALTTPTTGLFSHPWKLLTSSQFRRPDDEGADEARAEHAALAREVCGGTSAAHEQPDGVPSSAALTAALGEAAVVRGFDTSEVLLGEGRGREESRKTALTLVAAVQDTVRRGAAGAVVFPFVAAEDALLREVLAESGFRSAELTAATHFEVPATGSYEEFLGGLSRRHRHRFRREERDFHEAGLRLDHPDLSGVVRRVAELETANTAKHGGSADTERVVAVRTAMADLLGSRVRVPVAVRDGDVVSCGLHMLGRQDYCVLMYGSDGTRDGHGACYPCLTFYDPLRHAVETGIRRVRFGFEGFGAKLIRGATLAARETWVWSPDPAALTAVHHLMRFLEQRWRQHRARLPHSTP